MRELITSFLPAPWAAQLDPASLERVNGSYVSEDCVQRHSDMVWRLLLAGRWVYLYLLLEFQSSPDPWMALRMRAYAALLQQDLVKRHELPAPGYLAPVLPIVLYTGMQPWRSARNMQSLVAAGPGREQFVSANDEYLLLDIPRLLSQDAIQAGQPLPGLLALYFLRGRHGIAGSLDAIAQWLREAKSEELRRTVLAWIQSSLPVQSAATTLNPEAEEEREMLIMRLRTPDFDTAAEVWQYNTTMNGMEDVILLQLKKKFGVVPGEYARRLAIAIDKDFKAYADRILDAKTIVEVFEPDPAEDE